MRIIGLFLFFFLPVHLFPQSSNIQIINSKNGLSQNTVYNIVQDLDGYLWFSTEDGLNRYDGYSMSVYRHDTDDSLSLKENLISFIEVDHDGNIWVGNSNFFQILFRYHQSFFTPSNFRNESDKKLVIQAILPMTETQCLVATNDGLFLYSLQNDEFKSIALPDQLIPYRLFKLSENLIWISTGTGLLEFRPSDQRISELPAQFPEFIKRSPINFVKKATSGDLWISPTELGLFIVSEQGLLKNKFTEKTGLLGSTVYSMGEDRQGNMWVSLYPNGIQEISSDGKILSTFSGQNTHHKLPTNMVYKLFIDRSNILWMGSDGSGVLKLDLNFRDFKQISISPDALSHSDISHISFSNSGDMWVGYFDGGITILSKNKRPIHLNKKSSPLALASDQITFIAKMPTGEMLISYSDGEMEILPPQLDREKQEIKTNTEKGKYSFPSSFSISHFTDQRGLFWVMHDEGMAYWNEKERRFINEIFPEKFKDQIQANGFYTMTQNTEGVYGLGSSIGFYLYDREKQSMSFFSHKKGDKKSLSFSGVYSLGVDQYDRFWVGTSNGLNLFNSEDSTFTQFLPQIGLPNACIYSIISDEQSSMWVATNNGISKVTYDKTGVVEMINFDTSYGLPSDEFNQFSVYRDSVSGILYFGGVNGIAVFHPSQITKNNHEPILTLSKFSKSNKEIPLVSILNNMEPIIIYPKEHFFEFEFSGIEFTNPLKNKYQFQLVGIDDDYIDLGTRRFISFSNLSADTYELRVRASNSHGVWTSQPLTIAFQVLPPFYLTKWAYGIYVISLLLCIYGLVHHQKNQVKEKLKREQLEADNKRKSEELEYAREVQLSLLPQHDILLNQLTVKGKMVTATEVGGDYYDYFQIDDQHWCIVVGDATGHGTSAGMVVGMIKMAMNKSISLLKNDRDLSLFMRELNIALKESIHSRGLGMCLNITVININSGRAELVSTGLPLPYVWNKQDAQLTAIDLSGPPLGFMTKATFKKEIIQLQPGDCLLLFSDGFPERMNESEEPLDYDAFEQHIQHMMISSKTPDEMINFIFRKNDEFAGSRPNDDDMTVVILQKH